MMLRNQADNEIWEVRYRGDNRKAPESQPPGLFAVPHEHFCHFRLLVL